MCIIGQCTWRYHQVTRRYNCIKCNNYILEKSVIVNPQLYETYRFHAKCYGGPLDGWNNIRLPFGTRYFWTDCYGSMIFTTYDSNKMWNNNYYEYEIEPFGDFVFVRVRVKSTVKEF